MKDLFQPIDEEDIRRILSKFSYSDREAFDSLMNDDSPDIDLEKRKLLKRNFETGYRLNKRNNYKVPCKGLRCEEYDQLFSEEKGYDHCPGINLRVTSNHT